MKNMTASRSILGMLSALAVLLFVQPVPAQSDGEYGTTMNLSFGAGARAMGLGRAYVAIASDPSAMFWNPAGLELVPRASFTLFHHQLFEGTIYDYGGFVYPTLTYGTIGIGLARLGTGDIPERDIYNVNLGSLSYEEDELYFSYGKKLPLNLYGGLTFKIRRQALTGGLDNFRGYRFRVRPGTDVPSGMGGGHFQQYRVWIQLPQSACPLPEHGQPGRAGAVPHHAGNGKGHKSG